MLQERGETLCTSALVVCANVNVCSVGVCPCIQQFYHALCSCLCQTPEEKAVVFYSGHSAPKQNGPIERDSVRVYKLICKSHLSMCVLNTSVMTAKLRPHPVLMNLWERCHGSRFALARCTLWRVAASLIR